MANMLGNKGNGVCACCNDPMVNKKTARNREDRQWRRDYIAGEYMTDEHESRWYEKRKRLAGEDEATSYRGREN